MPEFGCGEFAQLGQVALGERPRAAREVVEELDHLLRRFAPSSAPATLRRSWRSRAAALLRGAARGSRRSAAVLSHSGLPNSLARVRIGAVQRLAQRAVVGVLHDRQDRTALCSVNFQPGLPSCLRRFLRRLQHVVRQCRQFVSVLDEQRVMRWSRRAGCRRSATTVRTSSSWIASVSAPFARPAARRRRGGNRAARCRRSSCAPRSSRANSGPLRSALYLSNSARFCPSSV